MLKLRSLILLCNALRNISLVFLLLFSNACSLEYLYDSNTKTYTNLIFVYPHPEPHGIYLTSQLKTFFNNSDVNSANYILKTNIVINEDLQLSNKFGFATQVELWIKVTWQIIDKNTNAILFSSYNFLPAYYHIMPSYLTTQNNKSLAIKLALKALSNNIGLKVLSLLKQYEGNFTNRESTLNIN